MKVRHKIHKPLTKQLAGHLRAHLGTGQSGDIRVVQSALKVVSNPSASADTFVINAILPVYSASSGSVALHGIERFKETGIILLVTSSSGIAFQAEMKGTLNKPKISRVVSGETARALQRALRREGKGRRRNSELRILRFAAVHCSALWLHHPKSPDRDRFVSLTPNFAGLRVGRSYAFHRTEFLLKKHATLMILRWYERYEKGQRPAEG
jgi:hypothetical protein